MDRIVKVLLGALGASVATPLIAKWLGRRRMSQRVEVEVRQLLTAGIDSSDAIVTESELADLPTPVQRYLRFAGVVGRERIRTARIEQTGEIRVAAGKPWYPFEAVEHFAVFPPAFHWHATASVAPFVDFEIRDGYFSGYGEILGYLASFIPVVESRGPEIDQGTLIRYLNEMVFFPTAFVDQVRWEAIDEASARVFYQDEGLEVGAVCTFDGEGRMVNFVADRYRDEDGQFTRYPWSTPFGDYREFDGFMLPTTGSAVWHMPDEELEYVRVKLEAVEFDVA